MPPEASGGTTSGSPSAEAETTAPSASSSYSGPFFPLDCWGVVISFVGSPVTVGSCIASSKPLHEFITQTHPEVVSNCAFCLHVDRRYQPLGTDLPMRKKTKKGEKPSPYPNDMVDVVYSYVSKLVVVGRSKYRRKAKRQLSVGAFGSPVRFVGMFPRLVRLEVRQGTCGLQDAHLIVAAGTLRELALMNCVDIYSDRGIAALTGLRELRIDFSNALNRTGSSRKLRSGALSGLMNLEVLQVSRPGEVKDWTDAGFVHLSKLRKLVAVGLGITDGIFKHIGSTLEVLVLDYCPNIEAPGFVNLPNLRRFWCRRGSYRLKWEDIRAALPAFAGLDEGEEPELDVLEADFRPRRRSKGQIGFIFVPPFTDDEWAKREDKLVGIW